MNAPPRVTLRGVLPSDLPVFFEHARDPVANQQAAFTVPDPNDEAAFRARWQRLLSDRKVLQRTVLVGDDVAGYVARFEMFGRTCVAYWIGREFWGQGIATRALRGLLAEVLERPIFAYVAADNLASRRVLEKCGFQAIAEDRAFAEARKAEITEFLYRRSEA
jgi:RimJ/RimL family protein N-acetyltransferase